MCENRYELVSATGCRVAEQINNVRLCENRDREREREGDKERPGNGAESIKRGIERRGT